MTLHWHRLQHIPSGIEWLGSDERSVLDGLRLEKRRAEWQLGRYVAKVAVGFVLGIDPLQRIQIIAAEDGAPEPFVDGVRAGVEISISHRGGAGVCTVAPKAVGCDIEAIEPRTQRFVNDFFTAREAEVVAASSPEVRDLVVALTWSAKESALKALRTGLRRDTRSAEVELSDVDRSGPGWRALSVSVGAEAMTLPGWWRADGGHVLTVIGIGEQDPPVSVVSLV